MRLSTLRPLAFAALLAAPAVAQRPATPRGPAASTPPEAVERYHEAARLYVGGQNEPALAAAEAAVALAPNNARMVALRDLIRQEQPPQDSPQQDPPPQDQPPDDSPGDGQNPPPEQPQQNLPQDPQNGNGQSGQKPNGQNPPPQQQPGGSGEPRMSREQADRILDAVGGDEKLLLRQMRREPSRVRPNQSDW